MKNGRPLINSKKMFFISKSWLVKYVKITLDEFRVEVHRNQLLPQIFKFSKCKIRWENSIKRLILQLQLISTTSNHQGVRSRKKHFYKNVWHRRIWFFRLGNWRTWSPQLIQKPTRSTTAKTQSDGWSFFLSFFHSFFLSFFLSFSR